MIRVLRADESHLKFINMVFKDSGISRHINDDVSITKEVIINDPINFLIVEENNTPTGFFLTIPSNSITIDIHTSIRNVKEKVFAGLLGVSCLIEEGFLIATSHIPEYNLAAIKYAYRCGFKKCGYIPQSYLFNGSRIGQHLVYKNLGG